MAIPYSLKQLSRWEWEYGAAMSSLKAPPEDWRGGNCGPKMKLIYALQVCGLGARVYKGLIFGQLRICRT
jgi:hypothetical protein